MSAASMLSGDAGGGAGAGAGTGDAGAGAAGSAAAPSAVSAVNGATQAAATATWVEQIATPEDRAYAQTKGFKEPGEVVGLYRNLEKLLGGEKLPMPKGEADVEGWNRVYKAIGRPETPEGYKLPVPAEGDKGFAADASKWFHDAGLSVKQANLLAKNYAEYGARVQNAQQTAIDARNAAELETFKREQGQLFDAKLEMGRRAAKQFGFSNEELVAFERAVGTKALLTRFAAIGEGMGEHVVVGDARGPISATSAQGQIDLLKKDPEFQAKYLSGDADAKQRMAELLAAANGMTLEQYQQSLPRDPRVVRESGRR